MPTGEFGSGASCGIAAVLLALLAAAPAAAQSTERVSVSSSGEPGNAESGIRGRPSLSADGWRVAFASAASNLVPGDGNGVADVFVRDRLSGTTLRASVDGAGAEANGPSGRAALSADGRFVAFSSEASNLVAGDANGAADVFVRDLRSGTTERVSVHSGGAEGRGWSDAPALSGDGRFVVFASSAALVPGDHNGFSDIYLRDRQLGVTRRLSETLLGLDADGASQAPAISADGNGVLFHTQARNLTYSVGPVASHVVIGGRASPFTYRSIASPGFVSFHVAWLSADGTTVAVSYPGGPVNNFAPSTVIYDVRLGSQLGLQSLIPDFPATRPGHVRVHSPVAISGDGRWIAVDTHLRLLNGDFSDQPESELFVVDRVTRGAERVHVNGAGQPVAGYEGSASSSVALSADGRVVAFVSAARGLVPGDEDRSTDVFVRERSTPPPSVLRLEPAQASAQPGAEHCASAQVSDARGQPVPGAQVEFSVSGVSRAQAIGTADASGAVRFCYAVAELTGEDLLAARIPGASSPAAHQRVTIDPPASSAGCRAVYWGTMVTPIGEARVLGLALALASGTEALQSYEPIPRPSDWPRVELRGPQALRCEAARASIFGPLYADERAVGTYRIDLVDGGPAGAADTYRVRVSNGHDSGEQRVQRGQVIVRP